MVLELSELRVRLKARSSMAIAVLKESVKLGKKGKTAEADICMLKH